MATGVEYKSSNESKARHRVLIVEDELFIALDLEETVKAMGFDVAGLASGQDQALKLASLADIAFVDVNLSDGSGVEVARVAQGQGIPVLFVTGNCPVEARALATGCLAKPYPQRDLLAAINAIEAVVEGAKVPKRLPGSFTLFSA